LVIKRFTLRYPEQKLKFVGDGYQFDPKRGVGIAAYRGSIVTRAVYLVLFYD
jgi:NADH-quinone oxidoreductase subunit I